MRSLRPTDLAREHGLSTQAVRNYESDGFLPAAERTASGYRIYTERHAAALRAYLALIAAFGYATAGEIMRALHRGDLDTALHTVDRGHVQLVRDRETLDQVRSATDHLATESPDPEKVTGTRSIGELARLLRLSPATLRAWERAGVLGPTRDPHTGYRVYRPADIRDARLAHLLRRGGYPPAHIAAVVDHLRTAGSADTLTDSLVRWQAKLTAHSLAMLDAAALLGVYIRMLNLPATQHVTPGPASTS
ncbi:MerR family DNA-binding transcriptional regulator [Nocardia higoensis]|uniref:MerR family DNA-binding transcriptional regulator n=1 Tax=Nocardia higoensis TaxID=228599 RepID=A0ABS0DH92_9NOCA|nr:MerR family transcriptional regulator [Nocardia higoensis]MBF6356942.1 MerR family DNA-binding transcriptional regulator [Nocardia higoensis]